MTVEMLKSNYSTRSKKDDKKKELRFDDDVGSNYLAEIETTNLIIKNIFNRFSGDPLFILIASNLISPFLYDNEQLYEIFLIALINTKDSVHKLIIYNEAILESDPLYYQTHLNFRHKYDYKVYTEWIYAYLFKAFDIITTNVNDKNCLSEKEYTFIGYIMKNVDLSQGYSEIWRNNFRVGKFIIQDLVYPDSCERSLKILEKFFLSEAQKYILEEYYELLQDVLHSISESDQEHKDMILSKFKFWIDHNKSSQILRDGLKKLLELLK